MERYSSLRFSLLPVEEGWHYCAGVRLFVGVREVGLVAQHKASGRYCVWLANGGAGDFASWPDAEAWAWRNRW